MSTMQQVMPQDVYSLLHSTIEDIVTRHRIDLLSISLVLAIYFSTNGVLGIMNSFDKALPTFHKRNYWQKRGVAFKITGMLGLLVLVAVVLIIGGEALEKFILRELHMEKISSYFWLGALRWLFIIFLFYFSISLIYYYGPAKHKRFQFFSAGSTLATIISLLIAIVYSWFINHFGQYNKLYGSIGTLLVTQLWIYYNAFGLLVGFELNASIEMNEERLVQELSED